MGRGRSSQRGGLGWALTAVLICIGGGALVGACASPRPYVSVVSASQVAPRELVVFVEIHNPSGSQLKLSELEYSLRRSDGKETKTRGRVALRELVAPGGTAVVDIHVPLHAGAQSGDVFALSGRLHGFAGDLALSWRISAAPRVN